MIETLYHGFQSAFWIVMAWGLISSLMQERDDLARAVFLNIAGQLVGFAILWFEASTGARVTRWAYYVIQFGIIASVMTMIPATRFSGIVSGTALGGALFALVFKLSGSTENDNLFHAMMAVSVAMLFVIMGGASGGLGARVADNIGSRLFRLVYKTHRRGVAR